MKKNYGNAAANWWAEKIKEENPSVDSNKLERFKMSLAHTVNVAIAKYAHTRLSTYKQDDFPKGYKTLVDSALAAGLTTKLPAGYEMTIFYDTGISVYNSSGALVTTFV